jgi:hypothetical protein
MKPRGRSPRFLICLFVLSSPVPLGADDEAVAPPESSPTASEPDWGAGVKECATCNSTGRITCPSCKGQGSLRKPCPICGGKGKKPCAVCAVAEPGRTLVTPGKIPCPACAGKGSADASPDRPCFRCRGAKEIICLSCVGKGTVSCPKTRYDKVCPTCGYVGRVPCPDCQGGKGGEASRTKGGAKSVDLPAVPDREAEASAPDEKPSVVTRKEKAYSEESFREDHQAASQAWEELKSEYEESRKIFKGESGNEIKKLRATLGQLSRSLADGIEGAGSEVEPLKQRLKDARAQVEALDRSWGNLEDHFDRVEKIEERLRVKWEEMPQWSPRLEAQQREAIREQLSRLSILLSAAKKYSATLREENPQRIVAVVKETVASTEELRRDVERVKSTAAGRLKIQAQAKKAALASRAAAEKAQAESRKAEREERRIEKEPDSLPRAELVSSGSRTAEPKPAGSSAKSKATDQKSEPRAAVPASEGSQGHDGLAMTLGMLGVALCGGVYYFLHRRDGQAPAPAPVTKKVPGRTRSA